MTTAIMRLTSEEIVEFCNRWGMDEPEVLTAFEEGTLRAYLTEEDFIAWYTREKGAVTEVINSIAIAPQLTAIMGSPEQAIIALSGGVQLESGVIVVPRPERTASQRGEV